MNELREKLTGVVRALFTEADGRPLGSLEELTERTVDAVMAALETDESGVTAAWWLSQLSREVERLSRRNASLLAELGARVDGPVS